jgi:transcriptional regulator with XRE-family HTH domain
MPSPRIVNGRRIRQAREAQNLSQRDLAQLISDQLGGRSFDQTKVSRIEHGARIHPAERPAFLAVLPDLTLLDEDGADDKPSPARKSAQVVHVTSLPAVYDADAIAEHIDVDRGSVLSAFRNGDLIGRKVDRKWVATADAVTTWLSTPASRRSDASSEFATVTRKRAS